MSGWRCLSTYRACASRGLDSRPHANREGEMVGIGVSLVRMLCYIFGLRLASTLIFPSSRKDLSIQDCKRFLKVDSFKTWRFEQHVGVVDTVAPSLLPSFGAWGLWTPLALGRGAENRCSTSRIFKSAIWVGLSLHIFSDS
jgi:hypothetical protein